MKENDILQKLRMQAEHRLRMQAQAEHEQAQAEHEQARANSEILQF